jgi:Rrf2 family iron-sulfur cluster assembly transcriptional regulator
MDRTLSSTGAIAVRAMIDLASQSRSGPVALAAIGQRQQVSKSYLDQLFARLRRHALVRATRGPGGGYTLAREAGRISVADIVIAVDEPRATAGAGHRSRLGEGLSCALWTELDARLIEWLAAMPLQSLVDGQIASAGARSRVTLERET